jgi:tetratricopeptide (TPR) repeat protein
MIDREQETAEAKRFASRAARLGQDDAVALSPAGFVLARVVGELEAGAALIDRALLLNPNMTQAWFASGFTRCYLGEPEMAIEHFARHTRLNPLDWRVFYSQLGTGVAHFIAGRYDEACLWLKKVLEPRDSVPTLRFLAASSALSGRLEEAQKTMQHLLQLNPAERVSDLKDVYPFRRPEDLDRLLEGLREAGLPE